MIELLSIDLSNYCSKQCSFCYNHSNRTGNTMWLPEEVIAFAKDCIEHGIKAVSLGGGEPFEYEGIFDVIDALYPLCYLSVTSNGLPLLNETVWRQLEQHKPDKIHITIHQPQDQSEVQRVIRLLKRIADIGIKPGVNLLVNAEKIDIIRDVYAELLQHIQSDQIILIPQRFSNTPSPKQIASITNGQPFQSSSCLLGCQPPRNFASISWDKQVNFCSYAPCKQSLSSLTYDALTAALNNVRWKSCL